MNDYIKYKDKLYQISISFIDDIFEIKIFLIKNGIPFGDEVYCHRTSNMFSSKYKLLEISNHPERFLSSEVKLQYLKDKEKYSKCKKIPKFPFQYMDKYLNEEMEYDEAVDKTIAEANRLIEKYVQKENN